MMFISMLTLNGISCAQEKIKYHQWEILNIMVYTNLPYGKFVIIIIIIINNNNNNNDLLAIPNLIGSSITK